MYSINVSNLFISRYGDTLRLTNLSLNKLVYFAQVESLRRNDVPLFSDPIEAWEYGPVEPMVYHAFKKYGSSVITSPANAGFPPKGGTAEQLAVIDAVAREYGSLTAFDLVDISHREGGAWRKKYIPGKNVQITNDDIIASKEFRTGFDPTATLSAGVRNVQDKWPNTLRMLEDA